MPQQEMHLKNTTILYPLSSKYKTMLDFTALITSLLILRSDFSTFQRLVISYF